MENAIYNELIRRDYAVDVGVVEMFATIDGKRCRRRIYACDNPNNGERRCAEESSAFGG